MGAKEAIRLGYHRRLVFGFGTGGASWGLLVGLLAHPTHWTLNDQLLAVLLVLLSALVLVTNAYMWRAMVAFTGAMWLNCLMMLCVLHWPVPWQILLGLPVAGLILLMYGRQLHRQSREGVVLDLINRRLNAEIETANAHLHAALGDAVMILELDHFKRINDTHGHAMGDSVLVQTCTCAGLPARHRHAS
jgi:membrane protein implicated in regulation of membrane protease activity